MTEASQYIVWGLILLVVILNVVGIHRLIKHFRDDRKKILLNLILLLIIPIFWSLLIILMTRKPKESKLKSHYKYMEAGYKGWTRYQ